MLPQTWEDPTVPNNEVDGAFGDNDPGILFCFSLWAFKYILNTHN